MYSYIAFLNLWHETPKLRNYRTWMSDQNILKGWEIDGVIMLQFTTNSSISCNSAKLLERSKIKIVLAGWSFWSTVCLCYVWTVSSGPHSSLLRSHHHPPYFGKIWQIWKNDKMAKKNKNKTRLWLNNIIDRYFDKIVYILTVWNSEAYSKIRYSITSIRTKLNPSTAVNWLFRW